MIDRAELLSTLHESDGYLSLIGYRYAGALRDHDGHDEGQRLAEDLKRASARCRELAKRLERQENIAP